MHRFFFMLFLLAGNTAFAQTVSGIVAGSDRKLLEGVTVTHLRTQNHVHSNDAGFFQIKGVRAGDTLSFSHVSYAARKAIVTGDQLNIVLHATSFQLEEVVVSPRVRHLNIISNIDLQTNPVASSQELLRKVPGLFIGQHAGGGKAEQIFLRGFDIDHGTDIHIDADGMPVNMVSHAHGQGYADLHFLMPEIVDKIDFDKGPYYANKGNLATAGYVSFTTKEHLDNSSFSIEAGRFNTFKTTGLFSILDNDKQAAWIATQYLATDGFFVSPQNFNRINLMGKYTSYLDNHDKFSVSFSHFNSKWDASGQIPERAVKDGSISRFGSIDDTEGGTTQRTNLNFQYLKHLPGNSFVKSTVFYSRYGFELYSNFTFFLNDPVNGDQIRQKEKRDIVGFESEWNKNIYAGRTEIKVQAGAGLRNDAVHDIELSHTMNRQTTLQRRMLGDVNETDAYSYFNAEIKLGKWLINPAVRMDYLKFDYVDKLSPLYQTQSQSKAIVSPKINFLYNQDKNIQYFFKLGKGFHSNDTRVVVAQSGKEILPAAYGADLGLIWKPFPKLVVNAAAWYLYLQQEFVYVGDEGVVEPSGRTERKGIDLGLRYQLGKYLFFHTDLTYTHARSLDQAKGNDYIPLAPRFTMQSGVSIKHPSGWNGSLKTRLLGDRAANEDRSLIAEGYCITDLNINYQWKQFSVGLITENIFNAEWKETQFATESRLKNELTPVTEIHFTPGTPFNARAQLIFRF